ncbi:MAG: cytochrome P450 [Thermodesulfobacteriota bacterium]
MQTASSLEDIDIVSNRTFGEHGYPHEAWTLLRHVAPLYWYDRPEAGPPFWAVTKHADIVTVSRQPKLFLNAPRLAVFPEIPQRPPEELPARHLLNMDPPEHGRFRKLVSARFTPRAVQSLRPAVEKIADDLLDALPADGDVRETDFVEAISARLPLEVLADLLGVPRADWDKLFHWTNETIGSGDPEYQRGATAEETADRARTALFQYFVEMVEERRKRPTGDIVSLLANADLDGGPVPAFELLSYYFLLVVAGNETTRNATSGGLLALIENPGELDKLRRDPSLIDCAVEEILRWTTPVIQFCRTAAEDVELRGEKIRKGEALCLFYPSANRDEEVFDDPFAFRIERQPNPHLAFGIGEHFCLGANLARLELRVIFAKLVERLREVELAGAVSRLHSSFVGGIKRVPIRYRLAPRGPHAG